ncbi:MarR family winged helix-turn-helix transcriptional regulator [Kitasatospora aureofaciens]|uniref:MarR family winged helix-turn-helix transcriptional regulator n=1 Tax=Kitasatospora aureofaciens TaxID=1894 RepID=UPI0033F926B4
MSADGGGLSAEAVVRLRLAIGRLNRQLVRASGDQDLTSAQLSALARVEQHGPLRLGELAAREGVAVPSMVRTVAPLVADGLIAKTPDPQDGRSPAARPHRARPGHPRPDPPRAHRPAGQAQHPPQPPAVPRAGGGPALAGTPPRRVRHTRPAAADRLNSLHQ